MGITGIHAAAVALACSSPPPAPPPTVAEPPAVPAPGIAAFPHPLITEVLFAVPTGAEGDANGDGVRAVAGDEFIELVNPHDKPIQLRAYALCDKSALRPGAKGGLRFTFPAFELPPGGVVVVFNGHESTWKGPVGDSTRAPEAVNPKYANAWVFTMRSPSQRTSFGNTGDLVLLTDPAGKSVACVSWGKIDPQDRPPPANVTIEEVGTSAKGSSSRAAIGQPMRPHTESVPGRLFSPGEFPAKAKEAAKDKDVPAEARTPRE